MSKVTVRVLLGSKESGGVVLRDNGSLLVSLQRFGLDLRVVQLNLPGPRRYALLDVEVLQDELELARSPRATVPKSWLVVSNIFVVQSWPRAGVEIANTITAARIILPNIITCSRISLEVLADRIVMRASQSM